MKRQTIDSSSSNVKLILLEKDKNNRQEFTIYREIGHGSSAVVYEAEYVSGGLPHRCIIKELYPSDCGLVRDERDGISLGFSAENEGTTAEKNKKKYNVIKQRYLDAYKIQNDFRNAVSPNLQSVEDHMLLSSGISAPLGIYQNDNGILYTLYVADSGMTYDKFNADNTQFHESLWDVLNIIIQTGNMISAFHRAGYLVLDIKESNILITGNSDSRRAVQFDFNSLIEKKVLHEYNPEDNIPISFSSVENGISLMLPKELRVLNTSNNDNIKLDIIRNSLGTMGERTDIFLLASILERRTKDKGNVTIHFVQERLNGILQKALNKFMKMRYSTMSEFIDDLRIVQALSVFENDNNKNYYTNEGVIWNQTNISKEMLYAASKAHWDELSCKNGKFNQLSRFTSRFENKVYLIDKNENKITPDEAIARSKYSFFVGEGGMGKSTSVYDFWTKELLKRHNNSKICLYIDLSRFTDIKVKNNLPVCFLTFLGMNIIQRMDITAHVSNPDAYWADENNQKRLTALNGLFSKKSESYEFLIILDGYNEILDTKRKSVFESELEKAVDIWHNVAIVLTSRTQVEKNNSGSVFEKFSLYKFDGVPSDIIIKQIAEKKKISESEAEKINHGKLGKVLRIPMFLNIYLNLHSDERNNEQINTCGELLDSYIRQRETETAKRISENNYHPDYRDIYSDYMGFIVLFAMPFAANLMEQNKTYYLDISEAYDKIEESFKIFIDNNLLYNSFTYTISRGLKLKFTQNGIKISCLDIDEIMNIITFSGYCYLTKDNEISFTHQYFRDYFAAKHIQNILSAAQTLSEKNKISKEDALLFTNQNGIEYPWSKDICILLGEIIGDYKNDPEYDG